MRDLLAAIIWRRATRIRHYAFQSSSASDRRHAETIVRVAISIYRACWRVQRRYDRRRQRLTRSGLTPDQILTNRDENARARWHALVCVVGIYGFA